MKHDGILSFVDALPDAPLPMPRQSLEREPLLLVLRRFIRVRFTRP